MPWIVHKPARFVGNVIGDGQCVAFVRYAGRLPHTSEWRRGANAWGAPPGTVIATFGDDGRYANVLGQSHAAVLAESDTGGIWVYDQWKGQPVHHRLIRDNPSAKPSNNAMRFHVVEHASAHDRAGSAIKDHAAAKLETAV